LAEAHILGLGYLGHGRSAAVNLVRGAAIPCRK
jgi:hypothetical protein